MSNGYHAAIWDRIPEEWRLAAKKCKCKERMINNIYKAMAKHVWDQKVNKGLWRKKNDNGIKNDFLRGFNQNTSFCFAFSWEKSDEGFEYWSRVNQWVNYYKNLAYFHFLFLSSRSLAVN